MEGVIALVLIAAATGMGLMFYAGRRFERNENAASPTLLPGVTGAMLLILIVIMGIEGITRLEEKRPVIYPYWPTISSTRETASDSLLFSYHRTQTEYTLAYVLLEPGYELVARKK